MLTINQEKRIRKERGRPVGAEDAYYELAVVVAQYRQLQKITTAAAQEKRKLALEAMDKLLAKLDLA